MAGQAGHKTSDSMRPAQRGVAIVKTDTTTTLFETTRAIYVGVSGDIIVVFAESDTQITLKAVPVGILWVQIRRVHSTGTTATDMVALY